MGDKMNDYELIEYRNKLAFLARAWRKELKAAGKTPKTILSNWQSSKRFMIGVRQLASKHGHMIEEEIS